jgi:hypothetical protein
MKYADHRLLWRMVEGAVYDALQAHPDYLTDRGSSLAVCSITKRVVGQLVGHANEARKRRPLGAFREDRGFRPGGVTSPTSDPPGKRRGPGGRVVVAGDLAPPDEASRPV